MSLVLEDQGDMVPTLGPTIRSKLLEASLASRIFLRLSVFPVSFFNEIKKISLQVNNDFLLLFLLKPCWICSNLEVVKLSFPSKIKVIVFDTA